MAGLDGFLQVRVGSVGIPALLVDHLGGAAIEAETLFIGADPLLDMGSAPVARPLVMRHIDRVYPPSVGYGRLNVIRFYGGPAFSGRRPLAEAGSDLPGISPEWLEWVITPSSRHFGHRGTFQQS